MSVLRSIKAHGCQICGYNKSVNAIDFHHLDPSEKEGAISSKHTVTRILIEVIKCLLVCSNCHRELHAGEIPDWVVTAAVARQRGGLINQLIINERTKGVREGKRVGPPLPRREVVSSGLLNLSNSRGSENEG